jgi:hypothetical protein
MEVRVEVLHPDHHTKELKLGDTVVGFRLIQLSTCISDNALMILIISLREHCTNGDM